MYWCMYKFVHSEIRLTLSAYTATVYSAKICHCKSGYGFFFAAYEYPYQDWDTKSKLWIHRCSCTAIANLGPQPVVRDALGMLILLIV